MNKLNQEIENNISRIKISIKRKIHEKHMLRCEIETLNNELREMEKLQNISGKP